MNENTNIDWTEWVKENDPETYYFNNDVCLPFEMMADAMTEVLDAVDVKELMKRAAYKRTLTKPEAAASEKKDMPPKFSTMSPTTSRSDTIGPPESIITNCAFERSIIFSAGAK